MNPCLVKPVPKPLSHTIHSHGKKWNRLKEKKTSLRLLTVSSFLNAKEEETRHNCQTPTRHIESFAYARKLFSFFREDNLSTCVFINEVRISSVNISGREKIPKT